MTVATNPVFAALAHSLVRSGGLVLNRHKYITRFNLNPADQPAITEYVDDIVRFANAAIDAAHVEIDAIAGIPTGGDIYARRLADCRSLPQMRLGAPPHWGVLTDTPKDTRVLLVDDGIATGTTAFFAADCIVKAGYRVAGFLFIAACKASGEPEIAKTRRPMIRLFTSKIMRELYRDELAALAENSLR